MYDYGKKLFDGLKRTQALHRRCLKLLMGLEEQQQLEADTYRTNYQDLPLPIPLDVGSGDATLVVFNPLVIACYSQLSKKSLIFDRPKKGGGWYRRGLPFPEIVNTPNYHA